MKVVLLTHTPAPEKIIAAAAKLCYSSSGIEDIMDNLTEDSIQKFMDMLMELGHESPIEHVTFTFGIEGISRACSHQLVRHRIASYSQKSQRYVSEDGFEFIIPPSIKNDPEALDEFMKTMESIQSSYDKVRKLLKTSISKNENIDMKSAEKRANEDARFLLPNACETKIVVTMNIRSLFNFFRHRCCNRAQWEIRDVAKEMLKLCMGVAPNIFRHAGPDCVAKGHCGEGKMTCGKAMEIRQEFAKMYVDNK